MIIVTKSPSADSRSAKEPITVPALRSSTVSHMKDVEKGIKFICYQLEDRTKHHDHTKIEHMEDFCDALNSENVKESDWYKLHITEERHHLKSNVPNDVNLIDVIEHLVDCTMAGLTRSGEIYDIDLLPEMLTLAVQNTVELLKDNITVIDPEADNNQTDEDILNDDADGLSDDEESEDIEDSVEEDEIPEEDINKED